MTDLRRSARPTLSRLAITVLVAVAGPLVAGAASATAGIHWQRCHGYTFDKEGDGVFSPETVGISCIAAKPIELAVIHKAERQESQSGIDQPVKYRGWTCRTFAIYGPGNGWNCNASHRRRLRYDVEGP